LSLVRRLD